MIRKASLLVSLILTCLSAYSPAQNWAGIIDPARAINWSNSGAGTIPDRTTQCGSTIAAYNGSATTINNAIASCASGQHVQLGAGTFNISTGIVFDGKSNVTLRGFGPDQTFIISTADDGAASCGGVHGAICIISSNYVYNDGGEGNVADWTGGFSKGTMTITLDSHSNLKVGSLIHLDQLSDLNDTSSTTPVCLGTPLCSQSGSQGANYSQYQNAIVTACGTSTPGAACTSNSVTLDDGVHMPNWRTSQSPRAWWSNSLPIVGDGIENLSIQVATGTNDQAITFMNATYSWMKNVRSIRPVQKHVRVTWSNHITIRDSYFFSNQDHDNPGGAQHDSYGVSCARCTNILVENNIMQWVIIPVMNEIGTGNVYAYNFSTNDQFGPGEWMQGSSYNHDGGSSFFLWEGNDGAGLTLDNYFGQAHFNTSFRNRWAGWEPQPAGLQNQTVAAHIYARNRYANMIGNVLGTGGYHKHYDDLAVSTTTSSQSDCIHSVYAVGLGSNCANGGNSPFPTNDVQTVSSLMRWGNYDTVNATNRFVSSEVPSGIANYPNPVPGSQALPASFYLSSKPSWFGVNGQATIPFPPMGPDVSGGDVTGSGIGVNSGLNGRVYRIPARACFESVMGGTFGDTTARTFNANTCYVVSTGDAPAPPTNVTATVR